jgi:hypothetical protein
MRKPRRSSTVFDTIFHGAVLRTFGESLNITIKPVSANDEWCRLEGVRSIQDFCDPTIGSVADNLDSFFDTTHGERGCQTCYKSFLSADASLLSHKESTIVRQHASIVTTNPLWTIQTPGLWSEELRVLASVTTCLAVGHTMPYQKNKYPDVYECFHRQLRCPEKASPLDLLHLVARTIGNKNMSQCVHKALHWISQQGHALPGLQPLLDAETFLGLVHPHGDHPSNRELLVLNCNCHSLRRYYSVDWSNQYINSTADLRLMMQFALTFQSGEQ